MDDLDFLDPAPSQAAGAGMLSPEVGPVEYTGSPEEDVARELTAMQAGFKARAEAERSRRNWAEDAGFFTCLVFQSAEQMEAFVAALGLEPDDPQYLDGRAAAERLGIELPPSDYAPPRAIATESENDWNSFVP